MKPNRSLRRSLIFTGSSLLAIPCAHAADGTWIQTGAGPLDWSAAATGNWSGGTLSNQTISFFSQLPPIQPARWPF